MPLDRGSDDMKTNGGTGRMRSGRWPALLLRVVQAAAREPLRFPIEQKRMLCAGIECTFISGPW